jgi:hypothetical protein
MFLHHFQQVADITEGHWQPSLHESAHGLWCPRSRSVAGTTDTTALSNEGIVEIPPAAPVA